MMIRDITLCIAILFLFSSCSFDEFFSTEANMIEQEPMLEEEMEEQSPLLLSLSSDGRENAFFDTFLIWLTDSTGAVIDSSFRNLQVNDQFDIMRPQSFTGTQANVNVLRIAATQVNFQSFENIELPSSYNVMDNDILNVYPFGNPEGLNPINVVMTVPEEAFDFSSFPESIIGRSMTAPELDGQVVADGGAFRMNRETGMYEVSLDLLVNDTDEILLYNSVTVGNFGRERMFSALVSYDNAVDGDSIRLSHEILTEDTEAQIVDAFSTEHIDGIFGYSGTIKLGEVFDNAAPEFLAAVSVAGIGIPSMLSEGNLSLLATSENRDGRNFRQNCFTSDTANFPISDMEVESNTFDVSFTDVYDFTIQEPTFEYDLLEIINFYAISNTFLLHRIHLDGPESSFIFPQLPEEFNLFIPFTWDESIFVNEALPIISFNQYDNLSGVDEFYNFFATRSLQDHENFFTENCISSNRVIL